MMIQIFEIDMSQFLINLIKREFLSCKIKGHKNAEKCLRQLNIMSNKLYAIWNANYLPLKMLILIRFL